MLLGLFVVHCAIYENRAKKSLHKMCDTNVSLQYDNFADDVLQSALLIPKKGDVKCLDTASIRFRYLKLSSKGFVRTSLGRGALYLYSLPSLS